MSKTGNSLGQIFSISDLVYSLLPFLELIDIFIIFEALPPSHHDLLISSTLTTADDGGRYLSPIQILKHSLRIIQWNPIKFTNSNQLYFSNLITSPNLHQFFLSPSSSSSSHLLCNIQKISCIFTIYDEMNLCLNLLKYFLNSSFPNISQIKIILPYFYSNEISYLCHRLILKLYSNNYTKLQSVILSFPFYTIDHHEMRAPTQASSLQSHQYPYLQEIAGIEYFDNLYSDILQISDMGFFDQVWPHLKVLHLGNLITRYFAIMDERAEDGVTWMNSFLVKFTIHYFPNVTMLDFDHVDNHHLLLFITSLAEFIHPLSEGNRQQYIWSSILEIKWNRSLDSYINLSIEEDWMVANRNFRHLTHNPTSINDDRLPSNIFISIFTSTTNLRLYNSLPSYHLLSILCSSSSYPQDGLKLYGFMDDPQFLHFLETPSLHPIGGISELYIFERICDLIHLRRNFPSLEVILQHDIQSSIFSKSQLDVMMSLISDTSKTMMMIQSYLTPISSRNIHFHHNHRFYNFLEYDSHQLTLLHINETHLREMVLDIFHNKFIFGNCSKLQLIIIELDLFCRETILNDQTLNSITQLIDSLSRKESQEYYSQLKRLQFNIWTYHHEILLQSHLQRLLPLHLSNQIKGHECISLFIHNRSGSRSPLFVGNIGIEDSRSK